MFNIKKTVSIILLAITLLGTFAACSQENGKENGDETTVSDVEETERQWLDSLEDVDYDGATVRFLGQNYFIPNSSNTKEVVSRAIYDKCVNVETRFNVKFEENKVESNGQFFREALQSSVQSGLDDFEFVIGYGSEIASAAFEGMVINLDNEDFEEIIDLSAPWWSDEYNSAINIANSHFWLYGYVSQHPITQVYCIYVNNAVMELVSEDKTVYDYVANKEWTLDNFIALAKSAYLDDGDGLRSDNDRYGIAQQADSFTDIFGICAGATYTTRDSDDIPVVNISTDKNVSINEKLYDMVHLDAYMNGAVSAYYPSKFADSTLLFYAECIDQTKGFRDMKDDWTIVPFPLYDETQENYYTTVHQGFQIVGVPKTAQVEKYEMIFTLWEATAAETYRLVRPAYLDEALKNKYSRDEKTKEMVDLIVAHMTTDFVNVYANSIGANIFSQNCFSTRDISSRLAKLTKPLNVTINKYVEAVEKYS